MRYMIEARDETKKRIIVVTGENERVKDVLKEIRTRDRIRILSLRRMPGMMEDRANLNERGKVKNGC